MVNYHAEIGRGTAEIKKAIKRAYDKDSSVDDIVNPLYKAISHYTVALRGGNPSVKNTVSAHLANLKSVVLTRENPEEGGLLKIIERKEHRFSPVPNPSSSVAVSIFIGISLVSLLTLTFKTTGAVIGFNSPGSLPVIISLVSSLVALALSLKR